MNLVNICSILTSESDTERQTIAWNPDDHKLYSSEQEVPCFDGYEFRSFEDAIKACKAAWGCDVWALEWQKYRILPDFYDWWGADADEYVTNMDEIAFLAEEWHKDIDTLMEQVELA